MCYFLALWFPVNKSHTGWESVVLAGTYGCNSYTTLVLNGFSFRSFLAVHADDFEIPVSYERHLAHFQGHVQA